MYMIRIFAQMQKLKLRLFFPALSAIGGFSAELSRRELVSSSFSHRLSVTAKLERDLSVAVVLCSGSIVAAVTVTR